jgi:hypothetical protein
LKVSIIIVNHNTPEVLTGCIKSIFKYESEENFEIIIVDNASKDNSATVIDELKSNCKNMRAIYLKELMSFSHANNKGIEISKGDYILIMNPDVLFESKLIDRLIQYLIENKDVGAVAPALIGFDGEFQKVYYLKYPTIKQFVFFHSIILRFFYKSPFFINTYLIDNKINFDEKKIYNIEQIPGAFFFVSRKVLNEIGLLDENFILFFEDVDLSFRIRKKYLLALDTGLHVKHLGGTSFKEIEWWVYGRFITSMVYFFKKHYSKLRYYTLKYMAISNAYCILMIENILRIFSLQSEFRIKKFNNFLKLVKEK